MTSIVQSTQSELAQILGTASAQEELPISRELDTSKRIYISNMAYSTSEEDLIQFFEGYNVESVLIPCHTYRGFKGPYRRPLGIAYAVLEDHEAALKAVEQFNGKPLNGRQLKVRIHVPYKPNTKVNKKASKSTSTPKPDLAESSKCAPEEDKENRKDLKKKGKSVQKAYKLPKNIVEATAAAIDESELVTTELVEEVDVSEKIEPPVPEFANETVFVGKLHPRTTDSDLRAFFAEFDPSDIYLLNGQLARRFRISQRRVSALVTLLAENGQENAIKKLSSKKLNGKGVVLRPAFAYKVEEVKLKLKEQEERLKAETLAKLEEVKLGSTEDSTSKPEKGQEEAEEEPLIITGQE